MRYRPMMSEISRSYSMSVVYLMSDMYLERVCDVDHSTNVRYVRVVLLTSVAIRYIFIPSSQARRQVARHARYARLDKH
jgi:hypothetical protein